MFFELTVSERKFTVSGELLRAILHFFIDGLLNVGARVPKKSAEQAWRVSN
jgi:hypothetical protein